MRTFSFPFLIFPSSVYLSLSLSVSFVYWPSLSAGRPGSSVEPRQVSRCFCIVVALNDTLASKTASVTQLIVIAAVSHHDISFQLKSYTCGSAALGAPAALTISRGQVCLSLQDLFLCFMGAAILGSCVCRVSLVKTGSDPVLPPETNLLKVVNETKTEILQRIP